MDAQRPMACPPLYPESGRKMVGTALRAFAHPTKLESSKEMAPRDHRGAIALLKDH
jgi:hypothetical protein